jgi:hypothetical protein
MGACKAVERERIVTKRPAAGGRGGVERSGDRHRPAGVGEESATRVLYRRPARAANICVAAVRSF